MLSARSPRTSKFDPIKEQLTSRRGIEKKALEFDFTVHDVSFNYPSRYFLRLAVQSSFTADLSNLRLREGEPILGPTRGFKMGFETRTTVTDLLQQDQVFPMDNRFTFYMPVGFNKNDIKHDVFLLVEAFDISETTAQFRRIGEARFAIYPRTDVELNFDGEIGDPIYKIGGRAPVFRTLTQDTLHMHCGALNYTATLSEAWPIEETPPTIIEKPAPKKKPAPTPKPKQKSRTPPPSPPNKKDPPPDRKTPRGPPKRPPPVSEDPDRDHIAHDTLSGDYHLVSKEGTEEVTVFIHGGFNMKHPTKHKMPKTFVTVRSKMDEDGNSKAQGVTYSTIKATEKPFWEEMVNVVLDANRAPDEVVIISVADKDSHECVTEYRIPVGNLQPFHHYHLDMQKFDEDRNEALFATVVRKQDKLPDAASGHRFRALEAILIGIKHPLENPLGALIGVAKIVSDYYNYVNEFLAIRKSGLDLTLTQFPKPHPTTFLVHDRWTGQGQPQVTLPGKPAVQPEWDHPFVFCDHRELATLFTRGSALVIEYYSFNASLEDIDWHVSKPVGYSALLLDNKAYKALMDASGRNGVVVELPVQGTVLRTTNKKLPSVGVMLRLHSEPSPNNISSAIIKSDLSGHPRFKPTHQEVPEEDYVDNEVPGPYLPNGEDRTRLGVNFDWDPNRDMAHAMGRKKRRKPLPLTDGELPPENAVESVLPEYDYIFPAGPTTSRRPANRNVSHNLVPKLTNSGQDFITAIDGQLGEIEKYKDALRKMGQDILALRERIRELEMENSALRRDLGNYGDTSRILYDSVELDGLPKSELVSRYATVKNKLVTTTSELSQYKDKVHRLQNELIKKNNSEGRHEEMNSAHVSQQRLLHQLQDKVRKLQKLEETCGKQEKVIMKMERLLEDKRLNGGRQKAITGGGGGNDDETLSRALMEENRRLRDEMDRFRLDGAQGIGMEESERLELYQLLDKAETRIVSLESQISKTARKQLTEKERLYREIEGVEKAYRRQIKKSHRSARRHGHDYNRGPARAHNIQFIAVPIPVNTSSAALDTGRHRNYDSGSPDSDQQEQNHHHRPEKERVTRLPRPKKL